MLSLGCSAAEMTWKAGIDVVTFGASKNGCLACEAVIFFDPALAENFQYRRKRGGHTLSKGRLLGAQMSAYLEDGHWLDLARHANEAAERLSKGLAAIPGVRVPWPVQANEVFAVIPRKADAALKANGHIPGPMIFARDEADLPQGVDFMAFAARFSHAYGDLRRLPTVLVENHSLKPYRQRVLGTYVLLETTLKTLASEAKGLKAAIALDRAARPKTVDANWKTKAEPVGQMDFLTIASEQTESPAAGGKVSRYLGKPGPTVTIPIYGSEPATQLSVPKAYWVPATKAEVIDRLKLHGIKVEPITAARTIEVEMIRFDGYKTIGLSEGRMMYAPTGLKRQMVTETFPPGSVRVPTDQPLGALATCLLEPESDDSFFAWGFFAEALTRVEYMEPYAIAPMAERMLATDPALKAEFEKKLKEEEGFAASPLRRLQFFYERSPFYDQRYLLYPVGREL